MSRHDVPTRDERYAVVVGWDPPLQTFFAQVLERSREHDDDTMVAWVGTARGEIPTVEGLAEQLSPYASLPADLQDTLQAESAEPRVERPMEIAALLERLEQLQHPRQPEHHREQERDY